jgi:integrase
VASGGRVISSIRPLRLVVTIRRSKTDQEGQGRTVAIVRGSIACPVQAVRNWLDAARIEGGPLFRTVAKGGKVMDGRLSDKQVARTIKAFAVRLGLDASAFGGHSLRSGFLTSAAARGANIFKMADQSGHKSMDTLRGYVRNAEIFQDHAGAGLLSSRYPPLRRPALFPEMSASPPKADRCGARAHVCFGP